MLNTEECKNNILEGMKYVLNREQDVTEDMMETEEGCWLAEDLDQEYILKFKERYIVFIQDSMFTVDGTTSKEIAKYIIDNINKIEYVYATKAKEDSVVGNVKKFCSENKIKELLYYRTIINFNQIPTIDGILHELEELNSYDQIKNI